MDDDIIVSDGEIVRYGHLEMRFDRGRVSVRVIDFGKTIKIIPDCSNKIWVTLE